MFATLVVGVDGSRHSSNALQWAADALAPQGRLHIVHGMGYRDELAAFAAGISEESARTQVAYAVEHQWVEEVLPPGLEAEIVVHDDHPASALMAVASDAAADAIVVGAHGRTRWASHHLAGVPSKLLHRSARPVVIVPDWWGPRTSEPGAVAVAIDGTGGSHAALRWAVGEGRSSGSLVDVAYLLNEEMYQPVIRYTATTRAEVVEAAEAQLQALLADVDLAGVGVETEVVMGVPEDLVSRSAQATLLVVGRGRIADLEEYSVGPLGRSCAARSKVPVVAVAGE